MRLNARTLQTVDSPITATLDLLRLREDGRELLDMAQAVPPYPPAPEVVAHVQKVADAPDGGAYTPVPGLPHLREIFAQELTSAYGARIGPENVLVTAGCNQAFCLLASALANPGDEVILPLPFYFNHDMWLRLAGITPVYLDTGADLVPDVAATRALLTDRTRMMVLVTPGNPSGLTLNPATISDFAGLAREHDIALVLDETYRSFRDTDAAPHAEFTRGDWGEHVVSLHSFSKDLAIPGYRVGALVCSPQVHREVAKLMDCVAVCAPRIGQEAAWAGLTHALDWRRERSAELAAHRHAFTQAMAQRPGGFEIAAHGGYFAWVRHPFTATPTDQVAADLVRHESLLFVPGTAFFPHDPGALRFSLSNLPSDRLGELVARLREAGERRG